jgi:hypothetical protein
VHFLLGSRFPETATPPSPSSGRPAVVVEVPDAFLIPNVVAINRQSSWMWLSRDRAGQGTAYLLHLAQPEDIAILEPAGEAHELVVGPTHDRVATLIPCRSLAPLLASAAAAETPAAVRYDWGHQVLLTGYQVGPALVPPGGATTLNLYWRGLTDQPDEYRTFVHVLDAAGQPVSQADGITLSEEQRWRRGRLSPEQHTLVLPADAAPGAYLVRVGLLTPGGTGRPAGERAGDRPAQAAPSFQG